MTNAISSQSTSTVLETEPSIQNTNDDNHLLIDKEDLYTDLSTRFYHAQRPDFETQLKGRHIGRCYSDKGLEDGYANVFVADTRESPKHGPITGMQSKAMIAWYRDLPVDYFENMTVEKEQKIKKFEDYLFAKDSILPVRAFDQGLVTYDMTSDGYKIMNEFRTDGKYIYAHYHDWQGNHDYCYFYKKVEEPVIQDEK